MQKYKKYLPSKKFSIVIISAIVITGVVFGIFYYFSKSKSFNKEKKGVIVENTLIESKTIQELIESDVDGDGVLDWEEALWGTDKNKKVTFDGKSDSAYIADKKKELNIETDLNNEKNLSQTDIFARQFFSAYTALKASGQADSSIINNFSNALGESVSNPNLIDIYSEKDIKKALVDNENSKIDYYNVLKNAFEKEKKSGIGDEINIISGGILEYESTGNEGKYQQLNIISEAYKNFAKKIIEVPVPESLVEIHLKIANSAYNTGISVENLSKINTDPIIGIAGLSQYQKYSDSLVSAVNNLDAVLN